MGGPQCGVVMGVSGSGRTTVARGIAVHCGQHTVVTRSALRRASRDVVRESRPEVHFCHVAADERLIADRLERRQGHYMPPSLLPSQLATLEPLQDDEPGVTVSASSTPEQIVANVLCVLHLDPDKGTS